MVVLGNIIFKLCCSGTWANSIRKTQWLLDGVCTSFPTPPILPQLYILGTKEELLKACRVAKENKVDIIIDAVLGHKLGADRYETFQAVSVDPQNRLKDLEKVREIEVCSFA